MEILVIYKPKWWIVSFLLPQDFVLWINRMFMHIKVSNYISTFEGLFIFLILGGEFFIRKVGRCGILCASAQNEYGT